MSCGEPVMFHFKVPSSPLLAQVCHTEVISLRPYVEVGDIEEDGWSRFLFLSNKITKIIVDCGLHYASLERIKLAKQAFGGEPFSQLQTLRKGVEDGELGGVSLVTVPSLKRVFLPCFSLPANDMTWVANSMPVMAPNIAHFGIEELGWDHNMEISRYSALEHLELGWGYVNTRFWESLASCQILRKIVLTGCVDNLENPGWRVDSVYFPALRTLKIRSSRLRGLPKLILRSRMPILECLYWDAASVPPNHTIDAMAAQLKQYSPKLDTDMLYHIPTGDSSDSFGDSDDDRW
ncbi:hypothetical protein M407DRAFT_17870 [Tulasnella calospora MUT 4182]|uniref:F-box domain-containing protein n=1 Tax=Tulasnella calospora MUT 4182 TaxID=1051891 RepID=A0A0C3QUZ8_9AGAM|nr:hypothetical protein M407DRAFT_17870 [Tulasnella calospora MUT 4182]